MKDALANPNDRREVWTTIAICAAYDGRFGWAREAFAYSKLADPPRSWPDDSEPGRMLRGEPIPDVPGVQRLAGWLLQRIHRLVAH